MTWVGRQGNSASSAGFSHRNHQVTQSQRRQGPVLAGMGILGIGIDVVHTPRIASLVARRTPTKLATRILSSSELREWEALFPPISVTESGLGAVTVEKWLGSSRSDGPSRKPHIRHSSHSTNRRGSTSRFPKPQQMVVNRASDLKVPRRRSCMPPLVTTASTQSRVCWLNISSQVGAIFRFSLGKR